jgi:hypothetical protein
MVFVNKGVFMNKSAKWVFWVTGLPCFSGAVCSLSSKLCLSAYIFSAFSKGIARLRVGSRVAIACLIIINGFMPAEVHAAKLLFKTDFGADTRLSLPHVSYSTAGWQDLDCIDANGKLGPINVWGATETGFELIADAPVTLSNLSNYMTNHIQKVAGPDGSPVNALFQNLNKNSAASPIYGTSQNTLLIHRGKVDSGDKADTGDVYYTYWFKLQPDLHTQLGTSGDDSWRVMSEWKTGGLNKTWRGDYRIITTVSQDNQGHLYWNTQGDNVANGVHAKQVYWQVTSFDVPVPVGEWFKYEVFWHRSNSSEGRYWAAVNGQTIVDYQGANMGIYNLPINRIMLANVYSGGKAPVQQWLTGLEIWDGFPCGVGVSCYRNPDSGRAIDSSIFSSFLHFFESFLP